MTLKWQPSPYKHPMSRARGLGSAKHGVHHWVAERASALIAIPLTLWAVWSVLNLSQADYAGFQD